LANNKEVASQDYEQAPEYQQHVQAVLASYDNPEGLLGELVGQLADAFWWIKVYRRDKENLILSQMATTLAERGRYVEVDQHLRLNLFELLSGGLTDSNSDIESRATLNELMTERGHNLASLRAEATRQALPQIDTLDRLIDRQFKNIRLLMQAHDSAKFAPQLHKKLDLEIKQLELQVKKSDEDQRLEVARQ
jgi:predicted ribosome quality control (RQC) complex YloA/Tae2 family protein